MNRNFVRRSTAWAILTGCLVAGLPACSDSDHPRNGQPGGAPDMEAITVVLDWSPNTNHNGVYLAQAKGWYDEAGLDVKIVEPGDVGSMELLAMGQADVGFTVQEEVIPARAEGVPIVGVAAVIEHNTSSVVSLATDGITRPRDLEGKTYGGFGGPLERALVEALVECDGGDPAKVTFAEVGEADYRVGLERNQYDAVWTFDGWDGIRFTEIDGLDTNAIPFVEHDDCIPDWYTPILAATETAIDKRSEALETFMDVTARGYRAAMSDPQAAADALLDEVPELDRELVEKSSDYLSTRYSTEPDAWGRMTPERWTGFVDFLVEAEIVDEPIDVDAAFTERFLPDP